MQKIVSKLIADESGDFFTDIFFETTGKDINDWLLQPNLITISTSEYEIYTDGYYLLERSNCAPDFLFYKLYLF